MKKRKGYIITVDTPYKNGKYKMDTPRIILDNKVWTNLGEAKRRIRSIVFNKCEKHGYHKMYDCLSSIRRNRLHSEMCYGIERGNSDTVKVYTIRPMQIG